MTPQPSPIAACVFDAYGTLFDVGAAARRVAEEPGRAAFAERWAALAETWRRKQLEYTWLRAVAGAHADFAIVTADALDVALETHGFAEDAALRARLLALYAELDAYPEAEASLTALKAAGLKLGILSNGSPTMLGGAVTSAGLGPLFDAVLSVEAVGVFKPHPSVYALASQALHLPTDRIAFISANGWDAGCAAAYGFPTLWINRRGEPMDRLHGRPRRVLPDLAGLPEAIKTLTEPLDD